MLPVLFWPLALEGQSTWVGTFAAVGRSSFANPVEGVAWPEHQTMVSAGLTLRHALGERLALATAVRLAHRGGGVRTVTSVFLDQLADVAVRLRYVEVPLVVEIGQPMIEGVVVGLRAGGWVALMVSCEIGYDRATGPEFRTPDEARPCRPTGTVTLEDRYFDSARSIDAGVTGSAVARWRPGGQLAAQVELGTSVGLREIDDYPAGLRVRTWSVGLGLEWGFH